MRYLRIVLILIGIAALSHAIVGVLGSHDTRLAYVRFMAFVLIGHELIWTPFVIGIGVLLGRLAYRAVVQAAAIMSAAVIMVALPAVLGYGRSEDLPSALPRDYGRGLLIILGLIWGTAAVVLLTQALRRRHQTVRNAQPPPS